MMKKEPKAQSMAVVNLHQRNLTLQLSHSDFLSLYALFADANNREPQKHNFIDMLLHSIMVAIYQNFHKEAKEEKSVYSIGLSPMECMAFWIYWTDHPFADSTLAGKLLDQLNNIILLLFTNTGSSELCISNKEECH